MRLKVKRILGDVASGGLNEIGRNPSAKNFLLGTGKETNPYNAPNIDFLRDPTTPVDYSGLKNPVSSDFGAPAKSYFNSYIGAINAPSSVDAVRSGMNTEQMNNLISGVQRDTKQKFGSELSDYFGRGLIEPGVGASSDIASNGLAQTAAEGARTAADVRLQYGLSDLERQAQREAEARNAYGMQYQYAIGADTQARGLTNQDLLAYYTGMGSNAEAENQRRIQLAQILSGQASSAASNSRPPSYGLLGKFGDAFAENLGKRAAG
jgi:hypothetical protein